MTTSPALAGHRCAVVGTRLETHDQVRAAIAAIDPRAYDKTRNYLDGAVTWLSPYITHGVINTRVVAEGLLAHHAPKACYRLLYELAWREYFHRVWQKRGDAIFHDLRHPQTAVVSAQLPRSIDAGTTGIEVLDGGIRQLKQSGWMHNHLRMWVAGITTNIGQTAWRSPAAWMYYHLLDGDLASNTLSWQWIAGTFSHKKYIANQDNINKYSRTQQHGTWLDLDYETLAQVPVPPELDDRLPVLSLPQSIPGVPVPEVVPGRLALRSIWNLNPTWLQESDGVNQVVFIERAQAEAWPMAPHRWAFVQRWAEQLGLPVWVGSVEDLQRLQNTGTQLLREEYPACAHWPGELVERDFFFKLPERDFNSFSQFWKLVK